MNLSTKINQKTSSNKRKKRVGRGPGTGMGKTSTRGHKGQGSRSGARKRYGYEGGQFRLYMKLPSRGFTRGRFDDEVFAMNLGDIEKTYQDNDVVSLKSLIEKKMLPKTYRGELKILSGGELSKKVTIEANKFSANAIKKLDDKKISYKILDK